MHGQDSSFIEGWLQHCRMLEELAVEAKFLEPAARANNHRRARRLLLRREEDGEGRVVDILHPIARRLLRLVASPLKAGRAVRPQRNDLRCLVREGDGTSETRHEQSED